MNHQEKMSICLVIQYLSRKFGHKLLIANDLKLALDIKADGVHIPERTRVKHQKKLLSFKKKWIITTSSHSINSHIKALKNNNPINYDFILLSPIFNTNTEAEKKGKKLLKISKEIEYIRKNHYLNYTNIILLGGITQRNYKSLKLIYYQGIAACKFFLNNMDNF